MAKKKKMKKFRMRKKPQKSSEKTVKGSIDFCQKCGAILVPIKKGKSMYMKCRSCGSEKKKEIRSLKIVEAVSKKKFVTVLEKDPTLLPLTERMCPKCEHPRSYWWLQQTRSADEPPTQFFRCEKCKHTWREYK